MCIVALTVSEENPTIVTSSSNFDMNRQAILIRDLDPMQIPRPPHDCNLSYDLRVGTRYRDHRDKEPKTLKENGCIRIAPQSAVIIRIMEEVRFPSSLFGHIVPKVSLLQTGIANTPTKIDPGYSGHLLITTFNHGRKSVKLKAGQLFCSMYLSTTTGDVAPYDKAGKDLEGDKRPGYLELFRDLIDQHYRIIQAGHWAITALLAALVLLK
jgi:dCTP deaminase